MLEPTVDRFRGSVGCAWPLEVGQLVLCALLQGAAELGDLDQRLRHPGADVVDQLDHQLAATAPVLVPVGSDHPLVDTPGRLDLDMRVAVDVGVEQGGESVDLLVSEQVGAGVQSAPCRVERVALAAAVSTSGSSSTAAVLNPVNPSIATTSTASRHVCGRSASQVLNAALERPSTMSSNLAGPVPSRTGVRSMITVTYLSPRRVWRHTCSSTPRTLTPSKRCSSSMRTRLPSARTALLAVSQATPRPSARRATVRCWTTIPSSAHRSPRRESLARGSAAAVMSWRHTWPQPVHLRRPIVTTSVVGRQPSGSCANRRVTLSRGVPSQPHRRHHRSGSTTRHARTARSGSSRWPVTSRSSSSSRQNLVRSGQAKVASGTSRSSGWAVWELPSSGRPRPPTRSPTRRQNCRPDYTLIGKSRKRPRPGARQGSAPARCWRQRGRTIPARDAGRGVGDTVWAWSTCPECRDRRWTG